MELEQIKYIERNAVFPEDFKLNKNNLAKVNISLKQRTQLLKNWIYIKANGYLNSELISVMP